MIIDVIATIMVVTGLVFFLGGSVGLVRFPDFYTRMHAAGKGDTLSSLLIIGGVAVFHLHEVLHAIDHGDWHQPVLVILKLIAISALIMVTSPTSTHALIQAGYDDGIKPNVVRDELSDRPKD